MNTQDRSVVARPNAMGSALRNSVAVAAMLSIPGLCYAQTASTPVPATQPEAAAPATPATATADQKTVIFVRTLQGKAIARKLPGMEAVAIKVGDTIDENTEILTGQSATVQIQVGSGQVFTIDRGSKILVKTAINSGGKDITKIEVPLGRIGFDVARVAGDNDVEIKAPDATLAVKGTTGFIDVTAGQATYASGGDFNTGQFNMLYSSSNALARVTGAKKSASSRITVAKTESGNLFVDAGDKSSRSGDEKKFVEDHLTQTVASDSSVKAIDNNRTFAKGGSYYETSVGGNILAKLDASGIAFSQQGGYGGFAVNPTAGTTVTNGNNVQIFTVENIETTSDVKGASSASTPVIRMLTVRPGSFTYQIVASFPETGTFGRTSWKFSGLAKMGRELYSSGTTYTDFGTKDQQEERGQIYMLAIDANAGPSTPRPMMNLGLDLQRGLAGDTSRGSLFVAGSLPGTTFGFGGASSAVILQVDPRNNLIQNGWSNQTGQLNPGAGNALGGMNSITGLSMVGGTLVITGTDGSRNAIRSVFSPFANRNRGAIGASTITGSGTNSIRVAFSGDNSGVAPNPGNLLPIGSAQTPARDEINLMFSNMAYTTGARRSGVIELLVKQQILSTASDRDGCARSGDLSMLPSILGLYDNQRAGIGLSIAEFRRRLLESGHRDCLPRSLFPGRSS